MKPFLSSSKLWHIALVGFWILLVSLGLHLILGCGSTENSNKEFLKLDLKNSTWFSKGKTIGIYINPSGQELLDRTYYNAISLNLMSLGYKVMDLNDQIHQQAKAFGIWNGHTAMRDSLRINGFLKNVNTLVVIHTRWDSLPMFKVINYERPQYIVKGPLIFFSIPLAEWKVLKAYTELRFYNAITGDTLYSMAEADTGRLFSEKSDLMPSFSDSPWH
ncbi:MAG TPA: hypothetical protein VKI62_05465, partial [Bacteroidota bacterium]|nr:hypothetical protein [Bacteroidota bacterium]